MMERCGIRREWRWGGSLQLWALGVGSAVGMDVGGLVPVGFCAVPLWALGCIGETGGDGFRGRRRCVRVYSPAMVAFVGGAGVTAWFPLGPHETYVPWYHASPLYVNRVNVSNQYDPNANEVRAIYNQRTLAGAYASRGEYGYVNRSAGTVAMTQASFAAGRPVVRVNGAVLASAQVTPHPLVTPERTMVVVGGEGGPGAGGQAGAYVADDAGGADG